MNKELLFDSFSHLDESLLEQSELAKPRAIWHKWAGLAACLALVAVLGLAAHQARERAKWNAIVESFEPAIIMEVTPNDGSAPPTAEAEAQWRESVESFEPADVEAAMPNGIAAGGSPIANGAMVAMPADGAELPANYLPMIEAYKSDGSACYAAPKNGEVGYSIPLRGAVDEYGDGARYRVVVDLFRDEQPLPADSDEVKAEIDRLAALGYTSGLESYYDHDVLENAYFTLHAAYDQLVNFAASADYGYMLFLYAERVPDYDPDTPVAFSSGSAAADSAPADTIAVTPPFSGAYLTQEQAYADADFGAYLCEPPAGFGEREFLRVDDVLLASFRRGYDYVDWHVSRDTSDAAIPAADLTPELIAEQMYRLDDAGDTDGLRIMNFRVDYGGIFVRVTAKGVTAEWLYSQLSNLSQS